ncbi:MAG: hypothetical protein WHT06_16185 [Desulfobacterales bacterium]
MPKILQFPTPKGLNAADDPISMSPDFFPVFKNAAINEDGLWAKRPGYVQHGETISSGATIESLLLFRKRDGTQLLFAAAGGELLRLNTDGTWTVIRSGLGSNRLSGATFNDRLVIFNGVNLPFWTDGETWGELANLCTDWAYGDVPRYVITFKGRLFAGGRPGARQMIYYSALQDMNDWVSANNAGYIDLSMQAAIASGAVTGLAVWEGYLVFLMADECFVWDWVSPQTQGLVKVFPVGAPYGFPVGFGADLLFASRLGIKSLTRSAKTGELNIGNVSEKIEPLVLARMKTGTVRSAAIFPLMRLVLFHMPPSILVYDYARGAWYEWTGIDAASMLVVDYDLFIGGSGGKLYRMDGSATSDAGTAIDYQVETPWLRLGKIMNYKKPLWLRAILGEGALGALRIVEQVDFASYTVTDQTLTAISGAYWRSAKWREATWRGRRAEAVTIPLYGRGKALKFLFRHNELNKPFAIAAVELVYNEAGFRP